MAVTGPPDDYAMQLRDGFAKAVAEPEWVPCDCPKLGLFEYENGSVRPCKKCGGCECRKGI